MRVAIRIAKTILSTYLFIGNIAGARAEGLSFKGQTMTLEVGAPPAGALDPYARLLAPSLGEHLPGQPSVVVSNVPGAASVTLARQLYNDAPKDGSVIGVLFSNALVGPLFGETQMTGYDPKKFIYLGSAHSEGSVCAVRKDAGVKSVNDLLNHRILIGATSIASPNYQFAKISNAILGTKFKLILGYQGVAAIRLAMERKEVQGICTGWSAIKTNFPGILTGKSFAQVVAQGDVGSVPELSAIGVPALISLA
ncbi:MAG TPA: hypothetical protein VMU78_05900, partial [Methylocella sp.]|nr:hypothetical protein [Methylocella sp.]